MLHCQAEPQRLPRGADPAAPLSAARRWLMAPTMLADLEDMASDVEVGEVSHPLLEAVGDPASQRHGDNGCSKGKNNSVRAAQSVIGPAGVASPGAATTRLRSDHGGATGRVPRSAEVTTIRLYGDLLNHGHEPTDPTRSAVMHATACQLRDRTPIRVRSMGTLRRRRPTDRIPRG